MLSTSSTPPYTFVVIAHELSRPLVTFCRELNRTRIYSENLDYYARIRYKTTLLHIIRALEEIIEKPNENHSRFLEGGGEGSLGSVTWVPVKDEAKIVGDIDTRYRAVLSGMTKIINVHAALKDFLRYY